MKEIVLGGVLTLGCYVVFAIGSVAVKHGTTRLANYTVLAGGRTYQCKQIPKLVDGNLVLKLDQDHAQPISGYSPKPHEVVIVGPINVSYWKNDQAQ